MSRTLRWLCRCGTRFVQRKLLIKHVREDHIRVRASNTLNRFGKRGIEKPRLKCDLVDDESLT